MSSVGFLSHEQRRGRGRRSASECPNGLLEKGQNTYLMYAFAKGRLNTSCRLLSCQHRNSYTTLRIQLSPVTGSIGLDACFIMAMGMVKLPITAKAPLVYRIREGKYFASVVVLGTRRPNKENLHEMKRSRKNIKANEVEIPLATHVTSTATLVDASLNRPGSQSSPDTPARMPCPQEPSAAFPLSVCLVIPYWLRR